MKRKKIPYGSKLPVRLTECERGLVLEHTVYGGDKLNIALADGKELRIDLSLDDIEEIQGYVAAAANHCDDRKLQSELDGVFRKLQAFLDSYDDQGD